jgi:hypothetical protein
MRLNALLGDKHALLGRNDLQQLLQWFSLGVALVWSPL